VEISPSKHPFLLEARYDKVFAYFKKVRISLDDNK
jgi:hypothetical protein